jgi:16S rRNA U516 pseudouridylate synthase RsuA-like enzyme
MVRKRKKKTPKPKKKLTNAQKRARRAAKAERQAKYEWVFRNGKQVRVRRPPAIDGMDVDEFIRNNADPIWLHQEGLWEYLRPDEFEPGFDSSPGGPGEGGASSRRPGRADPAAGSDYLVPNTFP